MPSRAPCRKAAMTSSSLSLCLAANARALIRERSRSGPSWMSFSIALTGFGFADCRKALKRVFGFAGKFHGHYRIDHRGSYRVARKNGKQATDAPNLSLAYAERINCRARNDSVGDLLERSWSVFAELPDKCRLSIRVDGGGDLIEPIEAVYRFELYVADRRGFQLLVIFVSLEDEHVWLLPTESARYIRGRELRRSSSVSLSRPGTSPRGKSTRANESPESW